MYFRTIKKSMKTVIKNITELIQTEDTPRKWVAGRDMKNIRTIKDAFVEIENGLITDTDKFLAEMTERQDIVLNMTKMSDKRIMKEVSTWLAKLNDEFGNLDKNTLIKTGGYDKHSKHQNTEKRKETVHKNTTTVETLNYATQEGTVR